MLNKLQGTRGRVIGKRIGFFFGAGASIEFGVPSMKELTRTFSYEILKKGKGKTVEKKIFSTILKSLEKEYGKANVDLESIMTVISGLKDRYQIRDSIGDLGLFFLNMETRRIPVGLFNSQEKVLEILETKFKEFIRENVIIKPSKNIDRMREVYSDFFGQLCSVTDCATSTDDINPSNTHDKWSFFTTNYDNSLEDYWNFTNYTTLDLGFYWDPKFGKILMDGDKFFENNKSNSHTAMQLIKLHGSVNWIINRNRKVEERELNLSYDQVKDKSGSGDVLDELMIYPLAQKHLYFSPYIQFFRILGAELNRRDLWIIIGYSFRDIIIRTMFERSLYENKSRLLVVHPHPDYVQNLFSKDVRKQILCLKCYFGKKDYKDVNKRIVKLLMKNS